MDAITYIVTKWDVRLGGRNPVEIPDTDRVTLARLFYELGHQRGVEVGVERGHYSEVLAQQNPGVRLTCVDAWTAYHGYRDHVSQSKLDRFYAEATERLKPYGGVTLLRSFSVPAAETFADGSLDFVYIDAAHDIASVVADLKA